MSKYNKEELEDLILEKKLSYEEIGRRFNVSGSAIRRAAQRLDIKLPKKREVNELEHFNRGKSLVTLLPELEFISIIETSVGWKEIVGKMGYKMNGSDVRNNILKRCSQLNITPNISNPPCISTQTKGELFTNRKNWQSARSSIQETARKIFMYYNKLPKCAKCGYTNHVEVAHIKAVSDFSDDTPISIINSIDNLIGLCPNHHWEYDNGILEL